MRSCPYIILYINVLFESLPHPQPLTCALLAKGCTVYNRIGVHGAMLRQVEADIYRWNQNICRLDGVETISKIEDIEAELPNRMKVWGMNEYMWNFVIHCVATLRFVETCLTTLGLLYMLNWYGWNIHIRIVDIYKVRHDCFQVPMGVVKQKTFLWHWLVICRDISGYLDCIKHQSDSG